MKLLVLTDLHITADNRTIIGLNPATRMRAVLDHALAHHADADHLVITGDLTHHGQPAEYDALREIMRGCPVPVTYLIGNHDDRANFIAAFPDAPTADGFVQTAFDTATHRIITLDSVQRTNNPVPHSGILCATRLAWLQTQLQTDLDVLVFIHHPPVSTGFKGMDRIGLRNRRELRDMLAASGRVKHVIAGHIHRTISGNVDGIGYSTLKSPCHQMPMILADDDSSLSIDEPGAYGIVLLSDGHITVHTEDVFAHADAPKTQTDPHSA